MAWQQFLKESNNPVQALPTTWLNFPGGSDGKAFAYNAGDPGSIPGSGRSPGEGNGSPLQYSCLENPMDRESPGEGNGNPPQYSCLENPMDGEAW